MRFLRRFPLGTAAALLVVVFSCTAKDNPLGVDPSEDAVNLIAVASAVEVGGLVFGPETFHVERRSKTEIREFSTVGFEGPFTLHLENGDTRGESRVRDARVILNGVTIFGRDDFPEWDRDDDEDDDDGDDDDDDRLDLRVVGVDLTEQSVLEVYIAGKDDGDDDDEDDGDDYDWDDDRGRFLRIRIQGGGAVLAGPDGGPLELAGGEVELDLPAGAITQEVVLTADPVEPPPESEVGERPVTVIELGPDGFEFEQPIELAFTYDPVVLAEEYPDIVEEDLALFTFDEENGVWVLLADGVVDPVTKTVSGTTTHFSQFGILTLTRVCPGEYADVQAAYAATIPGGMIEICDGTHPVEGVVLDAPVTIQAVAGANPVLQTSTALSTFFLDGYAGTVLIDGLTFDFSTPDPVPGSLATRSYAIRGTGTYDQLIVRNSTFNIGPVSRGSVLFFNNTVTGSGALVENSLFNGGAFGVAIFQAGLDTRLDVLNSQFSGTRSRALLYSAASGRVEGSTFENCGSVACVTVSRGTSAVEVVSNHFTGSELTGVSGPDLNSLVRISLGSSALVDDNDMVGCGYFQCVGVFGVGTDVTTSNNRLTFVPGRPYNEFNAMIRYENDPTGLVEGNQITGCFFLCINGTFRANITVRANQITIPTGQTAGFGINGFGGENAADSPTLVVEDNTIIADLTGVVLSDPSTFRITGSGIEMGNATATVHRNTIVGAARGVVAFNGGQITAGEDNVIDQSHWGVMIQDVASINLSFNDITNSFFSIFDADFASDLRCNWWGDALGPGSNTDGTVDLGTFSPWATAPIAGGDHSICDPDGNTVLLSAFATFQDAVDAVPEGGTILVGDGLHSVEGVTLNKPVTIQAVAGASPVLQTSVALSTFFLDGYTTGTVVIDELTFDFSTPTGGTTPTRSFAIRGTGTYDQLIVRNSTFNIGPVSRGSVFFFDNTVTGSGALVENSTFNGGVFGVVVFQAGADTRLDVLNSQFSGNRLLYSAASGRVEGSTFENCGSGSCVSVSSGSSGVEVVSNVFAAPVLTGDGGPDLNQLVRFSGSTTGLIDSNTFAGCGFFSCLSVAGAVIVSNNDIHHVAGQPEFEFATIISAFGSVAVTLDNNDIHSCAVFCYNIGLGSTIEIRNDTVDVPAGHGTSTVLTVHVFDDPTAPMNNLIFEDNVVTGSGGELGLSVFDTDLTINRNTFTQMDVGMEVGTGLTHVTTVSGRDNAFSQTGTALSIGEGTSVDLSFNDFTGQVTDIGFAGIGTNLTCNWWGNIAGPQNAVGIPVEVYTPWATALVAGTSATTCTGGP